jgi:hypothetical protein
VEGAASTFSFSMRHFCRHPGQRKSLLLLCDMEAFCEWLTLVELPIKGHIKTFMALSFGDAGVVVGFVWS